MQRASKLRPGDLVEVRTPDKILQTLDADGTLNQLPFMPEMVEFCGRKFRVAKRLVKTCISYRGTTMRVPKIDDIVLLAELRCSGLGHDGCQKACMIFWREAWLRKVEPTEPPPHVEPQATEQLRARLRTSSGPNCYFCQASELLRTTDPLSRSGRVTNCLAEIRAGNCSIPQMVARIAIWAFWRTRRAFLGEYARGSNPSTPVEALSLQSGEMVQVKPLASVAETLNPGGRNRGLYFTPDMAQLCGQRRRVERRLDRIICDGTGEVRQLRNTVYLEGGHCGCSHVAFGGCPRGEFSYWREIWLRRAAPSAASECEDHKVERPQIAAPVQGGR